MGKKHKYGIQKIPLETVSCGYYFLKSILKWYYFAPYCKKLWSRVEEKWGTTRIPLSFPDYYFRSLL